MNDKRDVTRENQLMTFGPNLSVLERTYRAHASQAVAHVGLSQSMAWPLIVISRNGEGLRQGVLATRLGIEGPSLVRTVDQLADNGLIERHEDPLDRRAKILLLTEEGQKAAQQVEDSLHEMRTKLFEGVSNEDLNVMQRVFATLQERLGCAHLAVPAQQNSGATE